MLDRLMYRCQLYMILIKMDRLIIETDRYRDQDLTAGSDYRCRRWYTMKGGVSYDVMNKLILLRSAYL
jgi:hypothetical protein